MKNKLFTSLVISLFTLNINAQLLPNGGFESGSITAGTANGTFLDPALSLPSWSMGGYRYVYDGTTWNATETLLTLPLIYNGEYLDSPSVSLLNSQAALPSNGFQSFVPLTGLRSIQLEAGSIPSGGRYAAAIWQTVTIPSGANSITFRGRPSLQEGGTLEIKINGQARSVGFISSAANYSVYGVDVSQEVGASVEVKFLCLPNFTPLQGGVARYLLDSISFSAVTVPEPSSFTILGCFGVLAALKAARLNQSKVRMHS